MLFFRTPTRSFSSRSLLRKEIKFQLLGIPKGSKFIPRDPACLQTPLKHTGKLTNSWSGPFLRLDCTLRTMCPFHGMPGTINNDCRWRARWYSERHRQILFRRPKVLEFGKVTWKARECSAWSLHWETAFLASWSLTAEEGEIQKSMQKLRDLYMHLKPVLCSNRLLSLIVPQIQPLWREKSLTLILIWCPVHHGGSCRLGNQFWVGSLADVCSLIASFDFFSCF